MQSDVTAAGVTQADLGRMLVLPSPLDVLAYSEIVPLLRPAQGVNGSGIFQQAKADTAATPPVI